MDVRNRVTRGVFVLDLGTGVLEEHLRSRSFLVLLAEPPFDLDAHRRYNLMGRVVITTRPGRYVPDATSFEYGIIGIPKKMLKRPGAAAKTISDAVARYRLFRQQPFLLLLGRGRAIAVDLMERERSLPYADCRIRAGGNAARE
jgi:hypothetical protein